MKVLLAIAATLALAGCASTAKTPARNARHQSVDADKMAQVEARAVGQGIDVIWVNPPTKKD